MGNIKLKDLVLRGNLNESDDNALADMVNALKGREDLVKLALQTAKKTDHPISENIMKNPRVLNKIAAVLIMAGLTSPSDLLASDIQKKIKDIFSNPKYTEKADELPPVSLVKPPTDNAYNKAAGENAGKQYEKPNINLDVLKKAVAKDATERFIYKFADSISRQEGKLKPYGIKSINMKDPSDARQVTKNSIVNKLFDWRKEIESQNLDKTMNNEDLVKSLIDFVAKKWCPASDDPQGNINWRKNIKIFMLNDKKDPSGKISDDIKSFIFEKDPTIRAKNDGYLKGSIKKNVQSV